MGSIDAPINPLTFALASEATFVARTIDTNPKHMTATFLAAAAHRGISFIEIMQNCVIFNDKTWAKVGGRDVRDDQMLQLEDGKPLIYGKERKKGIRLNGLQLEKVVIGEKGIEEKDLLVHDTKLKDPTYAFLLTQMSYPDLPTPMGVFRSVDEKPTYDDQLVAQMKMSKSLIGRTKTLQKLIQGKDYWEVMEDGQTIRGSEQIEAEDNEEMTIMDEQAKEENRRLDPLAHALRKSIKKFRAQYEFDRLDRVSPNDSISKVIGHFKVHHVGCILVMEGDELVGIVTERDILHKVCLKDLDLEAMKVSDIMTLRPDRIKESNSIGDAINHLANGGFRHLPIEEEGGELSIISIRQILGYIYDQVH